MEKVRCSGPSSEDGAVDLPGRVDMVKMIGVSSSVTW